MEINERMKQVLSAMTISGNTSTLTGQLDRKEYLEINEILETLGGVWNRKQKCHVWNCSPDDKLKVILDGGETNTITTTLETAKESKKKYQAFFTPPEIANQLVEYARIKDTDLILEPSAGIGNIVQAINRVLPNKQVDCFEILEANQIELTKLPTVNLIGSDFMDAGTQQKYNVIVMNPPFQKHQDITHIQKAYTLLADNGRLVSIVSWHSFNCSHKVDISFRAWLDTLDTSIYDIAAGAFEESGTTIPTRILVIDR